MRPLLRLCLPACLLASSFTLVAGSAADPGFHALYSADGTDVWAVGDGGVYYRSLDGGATWSSGALGNKTLRGIAAWAMEGPANYGLLFNVIVVGDSGKIWNSRDSGGTWSLTVIPGTPRLNAVEMASDQVAYATGHGGALWKTTDGGGSWNPLAPGTTAALLAAKFPSEQSGWVVGTGGTALQTTDGGASWSAASIPTTRDLLAIAASDAVVWAVGAEATAFRSTDSGDSWTQIDLRTEWRSDVRSVWVGLAGDVTLTGGGGFVRRSTDGGSTWSFPVHRLQAAASDLFFAGPGSGWICSRDTRAILRTTDSGVTWALTSGTVDDRDWEHRIDIPSGTVIRGSTFSMGVDNRTIYAGLGDRVFVSRDEGETWDQVGNPFSTGLPPPGPVDATNAFLVSPNDTMQMVAAVTATVGGVGDRIVRSTNGGASWSVTLAREYGEYGIPLELDHERPDTLYFGADGDVLYRSTDFGATWLPHSATPFVSPCDIVVVPGTNGQIIQVGDGITGVGSGRLLRSTDGGLTFAVEQPATGGSEVPGMASSPLRPQTTFATNWSSGGVYRSTDYGDTWPQVHTAGSAWGVDIAGDDPNCVIFGVYGGGVYLALDGGPSAASFEPQTLGGTNYSFFARDRQLILAEMSDGVYKLRTTYAYTPDTSPQTVSLNAPNGGETWDVGSVQQIQWSAHKLAVARLEYRVAPGQAWEQIADVPGYGGSWSWTVPPPATTAAKVRVRDAWDGSPVDSSGFFTVTTMVGVEPVAFGGLTLAQNQPNPFLGSTAIRYTLPARTEVTLEVFDVRGNLVATLVRAEQPAGTHTVSFPIERASAGSASARPPSGIYLYRLRAGDQTLTRKMVLMR